MRPDQLRRDLSGSPGGDLARPCKWTLIIEVWRFNFGENPRCPGDTDPMTRPAPASVESAHPTAAHIAETPSDIANTPLD